MTRFVPARMASMLIACLILGACGVAEGGAASGKGAFEAMADHVAAIPVSGTATAPKVPHGLRPSLEVEVMDVHDFWDAREGKPTSPALRRITNAAAAEASEAAASSISQGLRGALDVAPPRPAPKSAASAGRTIQLGAYSTEAGARRAWAEARGRAGGALDGLRPAFESIERGERELVRLKVGPVRPDQAPALCRAARIADPWCAAA